MSRSSEGRTNGPVRVGLIGAGYVSQFHIEALKRLKRVEIIGIADLDQARARAMGERFKLAACASLDELVERGADAVHVLTPPSSHAAVALEALEKGAHVLVEKPLATSVEDCDELERASTAAGKTIGVVHSYLCDPWIARALSLVRAGAIGDPLTFDYFRSSVYPPWRDGPPPPQYLTGGYPFRDLGVHALYLMQAFLGEIEDVCAQFSSNGSDDPNLLFDEWRALVRCSRGSGQIQLSWNVKPLQHVLYLQGTRGVLRADVFRMFITRRRQGRLPGPLERVAGAMREANQTAWQVPWNAFGYVRGKVLRYHGLQALVAEFYDRLAGGKPAPFTPRDARPIVEWTERTAREADQAKTVFLSRFPGRLSAPVLVTGATGFIGGHLLRRLRDEGERVRVFCRREPAAEIRDDEGIEVVVGDLGDAEALDRAVAGTRLVYHLGAAMRGSADDFYRGTVAGTRNLLDSVLQHGVPKLVYTSSMSVLHMARIGAGDRLDESWPLEPQPEKRGAYTQTKLEAERLVVDAARERGLPVVILRPGQVFGPDAPLMTPAVALPLGGRLLILGGGEVILPLIYVEDVVDAMCQAAVSNAFDGSIFHIADDGGVTQNQLANDYLLASGWDGGVVHLPLFMAKGLALAVEAVFAIIGRDAPLSRYRLRSALASMSFDTSAAAQRLDWSPRIGVADGLKATLAALEP